MNKMDKNMRVRENNRALNLIYKEGVAMFFTCGSGRDSSVNCRRV